jgi:hypothetical protein
MAKVGNLCRTIGCFNGRRVKRDHVAAASMTHVVFSLPMP